MPSKATKLWVNYIMDGLDFYRGFQLTECLEPDGVNPQPDKKHVGIDLGRCPRCRRRRRIDKPYKLICGGKVCMSTEPRKRVCFSCIRRETTRIVVDLLSGSSPGREPLELTKTIYLMVLNDEPLLDMPTEDLQKRYLQLVAEATKKVKKNDLSMVYDDRTKPSKSATPTKQSKQPQKPKKPQRPVPTMPRALLRPPVATAGPPVQSAPTVPVPPPPAQPVAQPTYIVSARPQSMPQPWMPPSPQLVVKPLPSAAPLPPVDPLRGSPAMHYWSKELEAIGDMQKDLLKTAITTWPADSQERRERIIDRRQGLRSHFESTSMQYAASPNLQKVWDMMREFYRIDNTIADGFEELKLDYEGGGVGYVRLYVILPRLVNLSSDRRSLLYTFQDLVR